MLDVNRLRVLATVARCGSVTVAARELGYAQPSISHHLSRLEAETGTRLVQRAGRGIRLTAAGRLLAERAEEILGRLDAAETELAEHSGLRAGRVRLAAFPSALGTLVPVAAAALASTHPGLELRFVEAEPPDAVRLLRSGEVDVALTFEYPGTTVEDGLYRTRALVEPLYVVTPAGRSTTAPGPSAMAGGASGPDRVRLADHAGARWVAGCERCRAYLVSQCATAGFVPDIAFTTDDYVAVQALVAAGLGVTVLPALALAAHRNPGVRVAVLPGAARTVYAATYGEPPDPPGTAALVRQLVAAGARSRFSAGTRPSRAG